MGVFSDLNRSICPTWSDIFGHLVLGQTSPELRRKSGLEKAMVRRTRFTPIPVHHLNTRKLIGALASGPTSVVGLLMPGTVAARIGPCGGPGSPYLVQHSAGSGKTNSIAWLAYGLATLHNASNEKVLRPGDRGDRPRRAGPPAPGCDQADRGGEGHVLGNDEVQKTDSQFLLRGFGDPIERAAAIRLVGEYHHEHLHRRCITSRLGPTTAARPRQYERSQGPKL